MRAIERCDTAAVRRLWNDDIAVWKVGEPRDRDRERALRVIDWFVTTTTARRYEILDRQLFDAVSSSSTSCTRRAATAHRSRCGSASWSSWGTNGLISRIDEYFDPTELAPLLA